MSFKELFGFRPVKPEEKTEREKLSSKEIDKLSKRIRIVDPDGRVENGNRVKEAKINRPASSRVKLTDETTDGLSRRGFLKGAAGLAGAAVAGGGLWKAAEFFVKEFNEEARRASGTPEEEAETEEQTQIAEQDLKSVEEIFDYKKEGRIEFNLGTVEKIKQYWKKRYQEDDKLRTSLQSAYKEMGYWRPHLEKVFVEHGLPKEYIYLAIPESHWQPQAVSRAGAVGPYQFMLETAQEYGLVVNKNIDQRKDPLNSGEACAKFLKKLYQKSADWSLTFSGYNGGYFNRYLKKTKEQGVPSSYEDFVRFMKNKSNETRDEIKSGQQVYHRFRERDNLDEIAKKYRSDKREIMKLSGITNEKKIKQGQTIVIPGGELQKQINFKEKTAGFSENLNYPAKFYAILELIKEGYINKQEKSISFEVRQVKQGQKRYNYYTVKKGETLYSLSNRFKTKSEDLKKENLEQFKTGLKAGSELKIPSQRSEAITLASLSRKVNRPISRLTFLNPALRSNTPIPDGYQVRV